MYWWVNGVLQGRVKPNNMYRYCSSLLYYVAVFWVTSTTHAQKPNLIVTTDIGQDPDDQQSMVRLLHYANDFTLLGLIANADRNYDHEPPELRTDILYELIEAYAHIFPNLKQVDTNYPSAGDLKKLVKKGCSGNGRDLPVLDYIGEGKSTEGSQWIIKQVDLAKGAVHIAVWGGACDVAQALFDVRNSRSEKETRQFVAKLRVYFIGQQDSSNQWIMDNFSNLWLVLGLAYDGNSWNSSYRGMFLGGDMQLTSREWLHHHVIGQNALGNLYPDKAWTMGGTKNPYGAMKEGDTPSFLFFLNNGLNFPEQPEWGGWGGRFLKVDRQFFRDAEDTFIDGAGDTSVTNAKATVFRWRPDFQRDFAARVQWGRGVDETVNQYPVITINEDTSDQPLHLIAEAGNNLVLDASETTDPNADKLSFEWMTYPEAGSFTGGEDIVLDGINQSTITISLPKIGRGSIHLILKVSDHAKYPLVAYKRVIIDVSNPQEKPLLIFDTDMGSDCDDIGALAILHSYIDQGKAELLGCIYSSGKVPFGAGIIDAVNTYYGRPDIPIGAEHDPSFGDPVDKMDAGKLARDTAAFGHDIVLNSDVPNQTLLSRQLLAAQNDTSVTYITVGHTKALSDLLRSGPDSISKLTGMQLVHKKIKAWVALGGLEANQANRSGSKDWNFFRNGTQPYTDYLLENFPCPAYFINAGSNVLTGQSLVHAKSGSIVRTAYRDWLWKNEQKTLDDGRPSWDLAAVFYAVVGQTTFFEPPEKGILHFDVNGGSKWEKHERGNHFYVHQRQGLAISFGKYLNSLIR